MKAKPFLFSIILITLTSISFAQTYKIKHLEPSFWWTGMQHKQLQILVHGDNIAELTPEFSYPNLTFDSVVRTSNPNYLFIYVHLNEQTKPGTFKINFKKGKKTKLSYTYQLKQRKKDSALRKGFDNTDAIYLITPDRFANGDYDNDEVEGLYEGLDRQNPQGRHGGDIQGVIDHLDYIKDMGFTAIWLNPVIENNHKRTSYHGYSTTDYYKVDARFGSNEDYVRLSEEASKRGIKLIMDQIMNHCGLGHWWTADPPTDNWYHYQDSVQITNHRRTTLEDPYASTQDRILFEDGWFVPSMPDLNQSNHLLADFLIQNSIWWVEFADLHGIRHDTHPYSGKTFMARYAKSIMDEYPNFNIVGEEWSPNPDVLAKWLRGKVNPDGFKGYLPSLMDFPLHMTLIKALNDEENWGSGFVNLYEMLSNDFVYPDPFNLVVLPDNHDMPRYFTQLHENFDLYKTGLIYTATIRGIPQIFYGTEYLATSPGNNDHGRLRSDFPGGWKNDTINAFTGKGLNPQQKEAQEFVKKLFNWRKQNPVVQNGKLMHFAPENGIYVYFRYNDKKTIMVILNKSKTNTVFDTKRFKEITAGFTNAIDVLDGNVYPLSKLNLEAGKSLILELR